MLAQAARRLREVGRRGHGPARITRTARMAEWPLA